MFLESKNDPSPLRLVQQFINERNLVPESERLDQIPIKYNTVIIFVQKSVPEERISFCGTYFRNNKTFLSGLGEAGMMLLLGALEPLFTGPAACKAFNHLFDVIAVHCSNKSCE